MALNKLNSDLSIIAKLGDQPGADNGLTTAQLKAKFDEAALLIQNYINNYLIPEIDIIFDIDELKDYIKDLYKDTPNMRVTTAILPAAGWAGNAQTVAVEGVTADKEKCAVITTAETGSHDMYLDCGVLLTGQGENTLSFTCKEIPEAALTVNVLILTKGG